MTETHTIDEAIERFDLISGPGSVDEGKACVMTAISWVTGEAWSDSPSCAHRVLRRLAIEANDADDTTSEQRAEILRAGETGLIDTWWIPIEVIALAMSRPKPADGEELPAETMVEKCLRTLGAITWWKADKQHANLGGANLGGANLGGANLRGANLRGADLWGARGNGLTVLPAGWHVEEATGLVARDEETARRVDG